MMLSERLKSVVAKDKRPAFETRCELFDWMYKDMDLSPVIAEVQKDLIVLEEKGDMLLMSDCALSLACLCMVQYERALKKAEGNSP